MMNIYEEQYHQFLDMTAVDSLLTHAYKATKHIHPACSYVASREVFTLLCMSNSNNLKALCIPHGEGKKILERKKK